MSGGPPSPVFFDHSEASLCVLEEGTLAGLRHRTVIDASTGAGSLALWQEEHLPGFCVPRHLHDCEEIITVLAGRIEAVVGEACYDVGPGQSILIPAWSEHGFTVVSARPIKLLAIFGSASPRIFKCDGTPSLPPWAGGTTAQFDSPGGASQ